MVKEYANGNDFYEENKDILLSDKYNEPFFRLDSPLLVNAGKEEYALRLTDGKSCLLALCVEPYSILLQGEKSLAGDFVNYVSRSIGIIALERVGLYKQSFQAAFLIIIGKRTFL